MEKEINVLKNEQFAELITPCSVFMTFNTEEGVNRALEMSNALEQHPELKHLGVWFGKHEIEI